MHKFFVSPDAVGADVITISGQDVNHIKAVLRMQPGEQFYVSTGQDREYRCELCGFEQDTVIARIVDVYGSNRELPTRITLFQALPKGDKMETIIQKAVELGVYSIVPFSSKRTVVKLDDKKKQKKLQRWNAIAEAAAKQSKRNIIPKVEDILTFSKALCQAETMNHTIIPYENAEGMNGSRQTIYSLKGSESIAVFIGPEGGFAEEEVQQAVECGAKPITLGHRILRTETAGMTMLSILMFLLEEE